MINICVPVLNRYDLLERMVVSLRGSTLPADTIWILNNGFDQRGIRNIKTVAPCPVQVVTPPRALGVAESWNWFIKNVPEERLITNDDIEFAPTSLEQMAAQKAPFVSCTHGFSCFIIRDECVRRVGLFDEEISPGYAYFEDCDYRYRMTAADNVQDDGVDCGVKHGGSQTIKGYSPDEQAYHYHKFKIAQANFIKKWGKLPEGMRPVE